MKNPINKRKYYAVKLTLVSPLAVSNGEDYYSDADVLRNGSGETFIPGTSLAGAFRNYLNKKDGYESLFGYSKDKEGLMSAIYISDLYFEDTGVKVSLRDRVKLLEDKTVENKFDQEIMETGASGILYLEYVLRKNQESSAYEDYLVYCIYGMQSGEIRFGSDKNRGYGRVRITDVYEKEFVSDNVEEWLKFQKAQKDDLEQYDHHTYEEWKEKNPGAADQYVHITMPLRQKGGISIRTYSAKSKKADYAHITCNDQPVIPGSSWCGAIRADARNILAEAGIKKIDQKMNKWFGCMKQKKRKGEQQAELDNQSLVVVGESILREGTMLPMTRNKINRFNNSTVTGALYSEISYVNGKTELELMVRKNTEENYKAIVGLLFLVLGDIQRGYLAVGGQTAVGRGIFEANGEIVCSEKISEEECLRALYGEVNNEITGS